MTLEVLGGFIHALAIVILLNRYLGGLLLRSRAPLTCDEAVDDFVPTVTVIVPLYNEESGIAGTLESILASDYPHDRLEVVCVDDCSSDASFHRAGEVEVRDPRLTVWRNPQNLGKRRSIIDAVRRSTSEIIVSIDSDVLVDRPAIRRLVRRFTSPTIGAVGGWVDVRNKHDNWLTRMQTVQYWYAYFVMRNIERAFKRVLTLSGCLTAYRRAVLVELEPILDRRAILGVPIKYGEDRFLARQIVKAGYETTLALDARCRTYVPHTFSSYFSQALRWRRSHLVDYASGTSHVWKLHPLIAINYFAMFAVMIGYPIALLRVLEAGAFFPAVVLHLAILAVFGLYYRYRVRDYPADERVSALSFVPQAVLMPVSFALLTPLALLTLDSTSWETRSRR